MLKNLTRLLIQQYFFCMAIVIYVYEHTNECACAVIKGVPVRKKRANNHKSLPIVEQSHKKNNTLLEQKNEGIQFNCKDTDWYGCWPLIFGIFCLVLILYFTCWQINKRRMRDARNQGNSVEDCF